VPDPALQDVSFQNEKMMLDPVWSGYGPQFGFTDDIWSITRNTRGFLLLHPGRQLDSARGDAFGIDHNPLFILPL